MKILCSLLPILLYADTSTQLPSSCTNLPNGYHDIQILSKDQYTKVKSEYSLYEYIDNSVEAPVVNAYCYNGYMIINPAHDSNFKSYFSSYHEFDSTFANPDMNDHVTWRQWWLPSRYDNNANFLVTKGDCNSCLDSNDEYLDGYGESTGYYASGLTFRCAYPWKDCNYDPFTLECYKCSSDRHGTESNYKNGVYYGLCGHVPLYVDRQGTRDDHSYCNEVDVSNFDDVLFIPSIGSTGHYCVCYKPGNDILNEYNTPNYIETTNDNNDNNDNNNNSNDNDIIELYSKDFNDGTYRIRKSGYYKIMEDIEFNFNAGDLNDPNIEGSWMPHCDQIDEYPGACQFDGWYWLGFFAGITIETDDVTIDLNDHTIGMSKAFYIQQRWFCNIVLSNKIFEDNAGPTFMGAHLISANNVVIKNGNLGLTSHAGIYGQYIDKITIENVHIHSFETHGIMFNSYSNLNIDNVEIGPSINGELKINGNYNAARMLLPTFRAAAKEASLKSDNEPTITFSGTRGPFTMQNLVDKLVYQMDIMFKYIYFGVKDENISDNEFNEIYELFGNPSGVSTWGVVYGLVLRPPRAGIWYWGKMWPGISEWYQGGYSHDAIINNLYIHDLIINTKELISIAVQKLATGGPLNYEEITDNSLIPNQKYAKYKGNTVSDIIFGLRHISNNWWHLASTQIQQEFVNWAMNGGSLLDNNCNHETICGYDAGGHVIKGAVGIKLVRSYNIEMNNIRIENIVNIGVQGSSKCGQWVDGFLDDTISDIDGYIGSGHVDELRKDGYTGTHSRGIAVYSVRNGIFNNIQMSNIMSLYGPSYGFYIHEDDEEPWGIAIKDKNSPDNKLTIKNAIFNHIDSGLQGYLNGETLIDVLKPNWNAESCAISCEDSINGCNDSIDDYLNIRMSYMNDHTNGCQLCGLNDESNSCINTDEYINTDDNIIAYLTPNGIYTIGNGIDSINRQDNTLYNIYSNIGLNDMNDDINKKKLVISWNDLIKKNSYINNNNNNQKNIIINDKIYRKYYFIGLTIVLIMFAALVCIFYKPTKKDYFFNKSIQVLNKSELKSLINK